MRQLRTGQYKRARDETCARCGAIGAEADWVTMMAHMFFKCKAQKCRDARARLEANLECIRTADNGPKEQKRWYEEYRQMRKLYDKASMLIGGSAGKGKAFVGWLEVPKNNPSVYLSVIEFLDEIMA